MNSRSQSMTRVEKWELGLILLTGATHVTIELLSGGGQGHRPMGGSPESIYNLAVAGLWGVYALWRMFTTPGMARAWGFRRDTFFSALEPCALVGLCAVVPLLMYGHAFGRWPLPATCWMTLLLYPWYGIAQQFALQALVARNLRPLISGRVLRMCATACIFSAAHFPNPWLMVLTVPLGLALTWISERSPNLWAVGILHGVLGALVYYLVLGLDPGAELLHAAQAFLKSL